MKKIAISFLLIGICGLCLIGCKASIETPYKSPDNDIVDTKEKYIVDGIEYDVYYDIHTNIIYLHINNNSGYDNIKPLIGLDKLPMTLEEFNQIK